MDKGKTQEEMERRGRKGSSCGRSEEMERAGDREKKMAGYFSTGQSPQQAVVLMEEEEHTGCGIMKGDQMDTKPREIYKNLATNPEWKSPLGRHRFRCGCNMKTGVKQIG